MANLNKVMLIGRLTRDPEVRTFANGGKVASFGFAVNNRRKNQSTGQWEEEPVFLDIEAFNRGETGRQLADLVEQYLHKGNQAFLEGHLKLDQWTAQDGQKRSRLKIVLDNLQFLERRAEGAAGEGARYQGSAPANRPMANASRPAPDYEEQPEPEAFAGPGPRAEEDIPF
jgi:single-strand DNA-binding protein